jgi:CubicO group peptidase (beta-lactamase class C family)
MPLMMDEAIQWARQWQREQRVPGMAVVVSDRTRTLHVELAGLADRAGERPVNPTQRWQIGSISKAFSSIVILQLQREGVLSTEDRVVEHLPWATHLDPGMTLHHLMTHTSGLSGGSEFVPDSLAESALQGAVGAPQPTGAPYWYSNPGYELLGDVIEATEGRPLESVLEARVLGPLGMKNSAASVHSRDHGVDVRGHRPPRDDALWRMDTEQSPDTLFPTCTADGSIAATPDDMGHYLRLLLNGGFEGVLTADGFAMLSGRHARTDDGWYGYGLDIVESDGQLTVGHGGGMVGMFADVLVDQDRGIGTCMLVNGYADVSGANRHLLRMLSNLPSTLPERPRPEPLDDGTEHAYRRVVGLYRSYNPWAPTFRILHVDNELRLADPVTGSFDVLHPESPTRFRVGRIDSPDVIEVSLEVHGRFQRMDLSGCVYGRARRDPIDDS